MLSQGVQLFLGFPIAPAAQSAAHPKGAVFGLQRRGHSGNTLEFPAGHVPGAQVIQRLRGPQARLRARGLTGAHAQIQVGRPGSPISPPGPEPFRPHPPQCLAGRRVTLLQLHSYLSQHFIARLSLRAQRELVVDAVQGFRRPHRIARRPLCPGQRLQQSRLVPQIGLRLQPLDCRPGLPQFEEPLDLQNPGGASHRVAGGEKSGQSPPGCVQRPQLEFAPRLLERGPLAEPPAGACRPEALPRFRPALGFLIGHPQSKRCLRPQLASLVFLREARQ